MRYPKLARSLCTLCTRALSLWLDIAVLFSLILTLIGSTINILYLWYLIGKLYLFTKFNPLHGVVTWRRRQNFYCRRTTNLKPCYKVTTEPCPEKIRSEPSKFEIFKLLSKNWGSKSSHFNSTPPKEYLQKTLQRPRPPQDFQKTPYRVGPKEWPP